MTPGGIEPATFRCVAQHLNYWATAVPNAVNNWQFYAYKCLYLPNSEAKLPFLLSSIWQKRLTLQTIKLDPTAVVYIVVWSCLCIFAFLCFYRFHHFRPKWVRGGGSSVRVWNTVARPQTLRKLWSLSVHIFITEISKIYFPWIFYSRMQD